jgi:hypothetical protein
MILLPVRWGAVRISREDAYRNSRDYKRLAKRRVEVFYTGLGVRTARERCQVA